VPDTAFRRILVASSIEEATKTLLQKWFATYLREVERQIGWDREPLPSPANYVNRNSFDVEPGEKMPKVVVISPGLYQAPTHPQSNGYYNASWQIAIGIAIAARNEELADQICKMYGAAIRGIMLQHQDLEQDSVKQVIWLDESYDDLQIPNQHQLFKAAASLFAVEVEDVTSRWAGPPVPTEEPSIIGEVDTADVIVNIVDDV
jgi:hypothetical protein